MGVFLYLFTGGSGWPGRRRPLKVCTGAAAQERAGEAKRLSRCAVPATVRRGGRAS